MCPGKTRLSTAPSCALQNFDGFISSAASCALEKGEWRFSRAQLSCRHVHICFQLRPAPAFWEEEGRICLFLWLYFYPAPRGFTTPCLQKLKFKTSWGRLPGGDAAQIPTSLPGGSPSTIWQCRLPRRWRSGGSRAHGPAPAAAGFIPVAPRGAEGDHSLG